MSSISENPKHILIFPYPAQGHMLPLLHFTHQLALKLHNSFTFTILLTPKNLPSLSPLLSTHPNTIQPLILPFPPHPSIPSGLENIQHLGNSGNLPTIVALSHLQNPILQWFHSHPNPPSLIISDFFLGWTLGLAHRLGIPRVAFFTSGAFTVSVLDDFWSNEDYRSRRDDIIFEFPNLPDSPSLAENRLPTLLKMSMRENPTPEMGFVRDSFMSNLRSWACVFNTFEGLEGKYLTHLRKKLAHDRIYGIGPLISPPAAAEWSDAREWLDRREDGTVLYVCFGSQKQLTQPQMTALALGLESSGVSFLWVLKPGAELLMPPGFEFRVCGRCYMIVNWAPQGEILAHKAIGGFLSHCGWNSLMEGVVNGVKILGWPMEADQHVNGRLLVEEMGLGVRVCEGGETVPDWVELGKVIGEVMRGVERVGAVKEMAVEAVMAVREGGSSVRQLEEFVKELERLPKPVRMAK